MQGSRDKKIHQWHQILTPPPSLENENAPIKCIDFESNIEAFEILDEPNLEKIVENLSSGIQALETNVSEILHQLNKNQNGKS